MKPPKYVRKNSPCLGMSSILDKGFLVMPDCRPSSPILRGFYKVDPELVPVPCHVGIPLSSLPGMPSVVDTFKYAEAVCEAFLAPAARKNQNGLKERVNRDWQSAYNSLRMVKVDSLLRTLVCPSYGGSGYSSDMSDGSIHRPAGLHTDLSLRVLCLRGARPVSIEFHPDQGIPPVVLLSPCALFRWEFFDAFERHYHNFPDVGQQRRAEKLIEQWVRPTLTSMGYAAWLAGRVCGEYPANPVVSEQIEYCLSRPSSPGPLKYPYLRSRK